MKKKELYAAPETEVLELHIENAILENSPAGGSGEDIGWSGEYDG